MKGPTHAMRIIAHPSPVLKERASEVEPASDADLRQLAAKMAHAMYEAPGVGLAAPQVGVQKRVLVFDVDEGLGVLCNPVIVSRSAQTEVDEEGCLSLPGLSVPVERSVALVCEALDLDGEPVTVEAEGLLARVIQHEIDHLDGVLIIDRATPEERRAAIRRYNEIHDPVG